MVLLLFALATVAKCQPEGYVFVPGETMSGVPTTTDARFKCSFENLWTEENHPQDYPDNAAWSAPIFVVHSNQLTVWETGQLASPGVSRFVKVRTRRNVVSSTIV